MRNLCSDDSDDDFNYSDTRRDEAELLELENQDDINIGTYVLVEFRGKKSKAYYVGQVKAIVGDDVQTHFMRRSDLQKGSKMSFNFQTEDIGLGEHHRSDIVLKLPEPVPAGGTKRCAGKLIFSCDLSMYNPL